MRLKWGAEEHRYFSKPIPKVERRSWFDIEHIRYFSKPISKAERSSWFDKLDDWFMCAVIAMMAGATIWMVIKIIQFRR